MFDFSKIFDLSKKFVLPDTLLKSKNYCIVTIRCLQSIISIFWLVLPVLCYACTCACQGKTLSQYCPHGEIRHTNFHTLESMNNYFSNFNDFLQF